MNYILITSLIIYLAAFIAISIFDIKKVKDFKDYAVAGMSQNTFAVTMSLLATVVGASTTIGITDTVYSIGFPGIWWLMFGAVGLILQSFVISEKVRSTNAATLPDLAKITAGRTAEIIIAFIIVISWIGVIAGQLAAMSRLITFATGRDGKVIPIIISLIIIIYTLAGGQLSVVRTDKIQFIVIIVGIIICFLYLYIFHGDNNAAVMSGIELINENYRPVNLFTQLFVIGGVYFIGPDIMSRNFISKDKKTARISALTAGLALVIFSVIITLIGMWCRENIPASDISGNTLTYVIKLLPMPIGIVLTLGLLSAILSSTDTCLINASGIFVKDILKKDNVVLVRITVAVIGILAILLAFSGDGDIMSLLSGAYSVYTPGVIFPLTIAVLCHNKRELRKKLWISAVVLGGLFGITSTYLTKIPAVAAALGNLTSYLSLMGMGVSLVISLLSIKKRA
ncbi:MAG: hypothetical protein IJ065_14205 [Eubacterium sp.]|nr:hypothetical protein [Eubacterium sp.]